MNISGKSCKITSSNGMHTMSPAVTSDRKHTLLYYVGTDTSGCCM